MNTETTPAGLIVPQGTVEASGIDAVDVDAKDALARHFAGIAKAEATFPALVKVACKLAEQVTDLAWRRRIPVAAVVFDTPRWMPDGRVLVPVGYDKRAKADTTREQAVKSFTKLRAVYDDCPQAVEVVFALCFQLVAICNAKHLRPRDLSFDGPRWVPEGVVIKVGHKGAAVAPQEGLKL